MNVSFIEAITLFFKKYADFKGRATRAEFWWAYLGMVVISTIIQVASSLFIRINPADFNPYDIASFIGIGLRANIPGMIFSLAIMVPQIAISCRRLHDIGSSGKWLLLFYCIVMIGYALVITGIFTTFSHLLSGNVSSGLMLIGLGFLPILGGVIWMLVWFVTPSDADNKYGPDPYPNERQPMQQWPQNF